MCSYQKSGNKNTVTKLELYYKDNDKINAVLPRWTGKTNSWMTVDGICLRSLQSSVVKKKNSRRKKSNLMFIGPCVIVIVEEQKTNLMSLAIFFFSLLMYSTCFGHYYIHHQELVTVLLNYISRFVLGLLCVGDLVRLNREQND